MAVKTWILFVVVNTVFYNHVHSLDQPGLLRFKYTDKHPDAKNDFATTYFSVLEVDKNARGYLMKKAAVFEHPVPILEGDRDYKVTEISAPYPIEGGNTLQQYTSKFITTDNYYMENHLVAADKSGNMVNYFVLDTTKYRNNMYTMQSGSRFKIASCPTAPIELAEARATINFEVDTSSIKSVGGLSFAHFQSVGDRYGVPMHRNTPDLYEYRSIDLQNAPLYTRAERVWLDRGDGAMLNYTIGGERSKNTPVSVDLILRKPGLYTIGVADGYAVSQHWGDQILCNIQVVTKGQKSWYDGKAPEVDVGGKIKVGRKRNGQTPQVYADAGYVRCSGAGNPLPEVTIQHYAQCNPEEGECPILKTLEGPYLTSYQVRPDVLDTVYFFENGDQDVDAQLGWYKCTASNTVGTVSENFELIR